MTSRHALLPAVTAAVVLALAMVFPFAGCGLPLQGLPSDTDAGSPCNADGQCKGTNPCMIDTCVAGTCSHVAGPEGPAPSDKQTAFDCKVVTCMMGMPVIQNDDADIQADAEDCTIDQCNAGEAFHTAKPDNTMCTMGGDGVCMGGKCQITCTVDGMCDDKNPCTTDTCDVAQGMCVFSPLNGVNTPGVVQTDFDCNVQVCVDGVSTKSPDDSDLPKTATECDEELCADGVPSNPPLSDTVTCGPNKDKFCDGAGNCVECNSPTTCPGTDDDCQVRSCTGHVCGITYLPAGTPRVASFQTPGDCKVVVCDGAGKTAIPDSNDDTDLPVDGNLCTKDVCTGGVISHPDEAAGTSCGVNGACDANGKCGCGSDLGCVAPDTCGGGNPGTAFLCGCTKQTCAQLGKTCGTVTDGCYSTQSCDNGTKEGTETDVDCGGLGGTCGDTCAIGKQCSVNSDCGSGFCADGVCCNTACTGTCLACSAAKKGGGADGTCGSIASGLQDPNATTTCIGNNACDGANNCKKLDGQACTAGQCLSGNCIDGVCCNTPCTGSCLACSAAKKGGGADGVCGDVPQNQQDTVGTTPCINTNACDGAGVCKSKIGQPCAGNSVCANGQCVDGTCCGVASCPACQSCALGAVGTCGNIPSGMTDTVAPNLCTSPSACDGLGNCKAGIGQPCPGGNSACANGQCVDGVCCSTACTGTCQACAAAKTGGVDGTCSNILINQQDTSATTPCSSPSACDGAGACKGTIGQACPGGLAGNCLSTFCADGVCCNAGCTGTCLACTNAKTGAADGTCSNVLANQTDSNATMACNSPSACDGAGTCKATNGQVCPGGLASNCLSGNCVDGVCCGVANCPACQSCALGAVGTCGNIPSGMTDTVAPNLCTSPSACDGSGNCKAGIGQPCAGNSACANGQCVDGVCCSTACTGTCQACAAAKTGGVDGTCSNILINQQDTSATVTCLSPSACDGAGACKGTLGQACPGGLAGNCLSTFCADGVCCNAGCTGTCLACTNAKTGAADGTCSNVLANQTDSNATMACNSPSACDGAGTCKATNGQVCPGGLASNCLSGNCVDGVCCGVANCPACQSCAAGPNGTCGNGPAGPDTSAPNTCMGTSSCDAAGNCKLLNGQACTVPTAGNCLSGNCADGVCCNTACGALATCMSCNQVGTMGTCSPVMGADDPDSCTPTLTNTCSATGACLLRSGTMCGSNTECASGTCLPSMKCQ